MKPSALTTTDLGSFAVAITPTAQQAKDDALTLAASVSIVESALQQQDAIAAAALLKSLLKGMESTRKEVKAPVLAASRAIDGAADGYCKPMDMELVRLETLAGEYQAKLNREAAALRAAEEARQREAAAALERHRLAELAEAQERQRAADAARLADLERIQSAKDDAAREEAQRQADIAAEARARHAREQQLHDEEMAEHRAEEARQRMAALSVMTPPKAAGARVTVSYDYELLDIARLYAARPDLVKLEERRALILASINVPGVAGEGIPGLRLFESTKVQAKA